MPKIAFRSVSCHSARNHSRSFRPHSQMPRTATLPSSEINSVACPQGTRGQTFPLPPAGALGHLAQDMYAWCALSSIRAGTHVRLMVQSQWNPPELFAKEVSGTGGRVRRLLVSSSKFLETLLFSLGIRERGLHPQNHSSRQSLPYLSPLHSLKAVT